MKTSVSELQWARAKITLGSGVLYKTCARKVSLAKGALHFEQQKIAKIPIAGQQLVP